MDGEAPKGLAGLKQRLTDFVQQSERVLNVTHKPNRREYQHIATSTAIGMAVLGTIGFLISMLSHVIRGA